MLSDERISFRVDNDTPTFAERIHTRLVSLF